MGDRTREIEGTSHNYFSMVSPRYKGPLMLLRFQFFPIKYIMLQIDLISLPCR